MQIPLNSFEKNINPTILKRGLQYFKDGLVGEIKEIGTGKYEAVVSGTKNYTVQLTIENDAITESLCDCPYDDEPECKHVVAAIYALQQERLDKENGTMPKVEKPTKIAKKKSPAEQVNELLEKVSHEELKKFVFEKTEDDTNLRNQFISYFSAYNTDFSREYYESQVKAIIKETTGRYGFSERRDAEDFWRNVMEYLQIAEKSLAENNFSKTMNIATVIAEQAMKILNRSDDRFEVISDVVDSTFKLLGKFSENPLPENEKAEFLAFCYQSFDKEIFGGWHWHTELLKFASSQLKTENELQEIFTRLDKYEKVDVEDKYKIRQEESRSLKYKILEKFDKNKAEDFLYQNLEYEKFRTIAIEKNIEAKDYEKAKKLALEGTVLDKDGWKSLLDKWYGFLLQIAEIEQDTKNIINYAKYLYFSPNWETKKFYNILKSNIKTEDWKVFVEKTLIAELEKDEKRNYNKIADIFIAEQQWQRLLILLKKYPSLSNLLSFEPYLKTDYLNELIPLYEKGIIDYAAVSAGREHYAEICKYIQRFSNLAGREKADELIKKLRETNKRRPAFLEELDKV